MDFINELTQGEFLFYRWKAVTDPFNFDTDVNPMALADGIAREEWTREFFNRLQRYVIAKISCVNKSWFTIVSIQNSFVHERFL